LNDRFIKACRRERPDATPVWFMRQAGRFLQEYRKIREKHSLIDICKDPELCAEVSALPVNALHVDAAILFADIMLPLEGMGVRFRIADGVGPVILSSLRDFQSVSSLRYLEPDSDVPFVMDAISATKKLLDSRVPLIGFCGAPFTLASYIIEGHGTRDFLKTKKLMYTDPETWHMLMDKLSTSMGTYLRAQANAGVDAVQLFDSWVGCLSPADYHTFVLPYSRRVLGYLKDSAIPCIHFGTGTATILEEMRQAGGDVFGIDWRIPIDVAWQRLGYDIAIQGNLDPAVLLADSDLIKTQTADILKRVGNRPGHIFNLGHGILPETPQENVQQLVEFVHEQTKTG
jgi:uroporphyrinogen decarboxylase